MLVVLARTSQHDSMHSASHHLLNCMGGPVLLVGSVVETGDIEVSAARLGGEDDQNSS